MTSQYEQDLERTVTGLEALEKFQKDLTATSVSMEGADQADHYLYARRLDELETNLGLEAGGMQTIRDVFSALGRTAVALGRGFMKFLDNAHRVIDRTYRVRASQLRVKLKAVNETEGKINKGRMPTSKASAGLAVGGDIPANFGAYADGALELSRRVTGQVIPDLASMTRLIGARLDSKKWMGTDAFDEEVMELVRIIGSFKTPMGRYTEQDFLRLFPGDRSIFVNIRPSKPWREPNIQTAAARKIIDGLSGTSVGISGRADVAKGKTTQALPILTVEQSLALLDHVDALLKEAVRVTDVSKAYVKDRVPSTFSMMLSGFYHGMKRQFDDFWTAQDDGFDVIEGAHQGGNIKRHKPGKRNMMGDLVARGPAELLVAGMEAKGDPEEEARNRARMAAWVSRYLKLSLIDHQRTSRAVVMLQIGIARSYMDYIDESLDYYH